LKVSQKGKFQSPNSKFQNSKTNSLLFLLHEEPMGKSELDNPKSETNTELNDEIQFVLNFEF